MGTEAINTGLDQTFLRKLIKKEFVTGLIVLSFIVFTSLTQAQNLLTSPQKIVIDAKRNRLLVSNDGTGNIVEIDSAGKQSYFVQKGGFIDGMEIVGDTVYGVCGSKTLKGYDLNTKQLVVNVVFSGTPINYLSSIAYDSAGHLFISCPFLNTIYRYRISDNSYWVFAQNNGLKRPNGILLERDKNRIVVIDDSQSSSIIHAISLKDSTVSNLAIVPLDSPDGIVKDKSGSYYIGGYYLSGIYKMKNDFSQAPELFYSGKSFVYPTYDEKTNSLLITAYDLNSWSRISLVTGVNDHLETGRDFNLLQNYPNPFNPSTTIEYSLKNNAHVKISLFNQLGSEAAVLYEGDRTAGQHSVKLSAEMYNLASGVYFYSIKAGDYCETKKLTLLK